MFKFSKSLIKFIIPLRNICLISSSTTGLVDLLEEWDEWNSHIDKDAKPIVDMKKYYFDEEKLRFLPRETSSIKSETMEPMNKSESAKTDTFESSASNESRPKLETISEVSEPESESETKPKTLHEESSSIESTITKKLLPFFCFCTNAKFRTLLARVNICVKCIILASLLIPSDFLLLDLSSSY